MQDVPLKTLNERLNRVLDVVYDGVQSEMARDLEDWTQSTLSRTLNLHGSVSERTLEKNSKRLARDLIRNEIVRREFLELGEKPITPEKPLTEDPTVEYRTPATSAVQLPRVSFRASAGDGAYVSEREVVDHYVIDSRELRRSGAPNGFFAIEVEGDSMIPEFRPGERLIIKSVEPDKLIQMDGVYIFRHEDMIQLKRLQRRGGRVLHVIPRNDRYPDYTITVDEGTDFELLGRVYARFERYS